MADLVAEGLVYREVAEALFVSRRTVETRVANIFLKVGLNWRNALTRVPRQGPGWRAWARRIEG